MKYRCSCGRRCSTRLENDEVYIVCPSHGDRARYPFQTSNKTGEKE